MQESYCPKWCEEHHEFDDDAESGWYHRSRVIEVASGDPEDPLLVGVEGWFENGDWNEVVSIGRRGEDRSRLTVGNAVLLVLALTESAKCLSTLVDDSVAMRRVNRLAAATAEKRLTVQVRRVGEIAGGRPAEIQYPDRNTVVITFREDCVSAEGVTELEALLPGLIAANGPEGEEEPDRHG